MKDIQCIISTSKIQRVLELQLAFAGLSRIKTFFAVIFKKTNGSIFQYTTLFFEMLARNKTIMCRFLFRFYCQFNCIEITFCSLILQFGFPFDCNSRWKISFFLNEVGSETFYRFLQNTFLRRELINTSNGYKISFISITKHLPTNSSNCISPEVNFALC